MADVLTSDQRKVRYPAVNRLGTSLAAAKEISSIGQISSSSSKRTTNVLVTSTQDQLLTPTERPQPTPDFSHATEHDADESGTPHRFRH
ncbi:hypothetical protein [Primorskyibacter flagellatus]|nr:hypothetical protein [Primorskyibacter flagellatus]